MNGLDEFGFTDCLTELTLYLISLVNRWHNLWRDCGTAFGGIHHGSIREQSTRGLYAVSNQWTVHCGGIGLVLHVYFGWVRFHRIRSDSRAQHAQNESSHTPGRGLCKNALCSPILTFSSNFLGDWIQLSPDIIFLLLHLYEDEIAGVYDQLSWDLANTLWEEINLIWFLF